MNYIDYSQYKSWSVCPMKWFEGYVQAWKEKPKDGPKDDALTLGSLFHNGLENWYSKRSPYISESLVLELNPSKEALDLAQGLVHGYVRQYPSDPWGVVSVEKALVKPLTSDTSLVAKVDQIARVESSTQIDTGWPMLQITLQPGIYSVENKTKAASKPFANYHAMWQANMQASFQLLALREHYENVKGVLVNVAEKPNFYKARRKCKQCEESSELKMWTLDHSEPKNLCCPVCGTGQVIKPYEPKKQGQYKYYRFTVERNDERLKKDLTKIKWTVEQMTFLREAGKGSESIRNRFERDESCVDSNMLWKCPFFEAHVNMKPTELLTNLERVDDPLKYIGLDTTGDLDGE